MMLKNNIFKIIKNKDLLKGCKIRLKLTKEQEILCNKHAGIARKTYNWGVEQCRKAYLETGKTPSGFDLCKIHVREEKRHYPYYYEVSKWTPHKAIFNLETSYKNFHREQKKSGYKDVREIKKNGVVVGVELKGLPQFKKKGINDSFYLERSPTQKIIVEGNRIKVPKFGWLKMYEKNVVLTSPIKSVTISRTSNQWFISFDQEFEPIKTVKNKGVVGVDLGIKTLATLSDGTIYPSLKVYKKAKRQLKLAQRKLSKKRQKGVKRQSNNYEKQKLRVSKIYQRIASRRLDYTHKITSYLAKNHSEIVIEDLNIQGMSKNHKLASSILDGGWYEFKRQLMYKSEWYGSCLTIVDRFFPSSKTCSNCQEKKKDLKLKERTFKCPKCGHEMDRDLNAAINLRNKAVGYTASACGEAQSIVGIVPTTSMKQENYV